MICKMFGFEFGMQRSIYHFGFGVGDIFMDDLRCTGDEASIFKCPYAGWGTTNCEHHEDVGVICSRTPVSSFCFENEVVDAFLKQWDFTLKYSLKSNPPPMKNKWT